MRMKKHHVLPGLLLAGAAFLSSCEDNVERYCFTVSDREPTSGTRVTFNGTCSEGVKLYHWNFGDGTDTVTTSPSVDYAFKSPGTYEVSLHGTTPEIVDHCPPNAGPTGARQTVTVK